MSRSVRRCFTFALCVFWLGSSSVAKNFPKVNPERVGLSSDRLERVTGLFEKYIEQQQLSGGGGRYSTAMDYLRFCQMLLNGGELFGKRVLSPKTVALMTRNHIGDHTPLNMNGFGFGLGVAVHLDPAESGSLESIGIAMSQLSPNGHLDTARRFKLLVYQSLIE